MSSEVSEKLQQFYDNYVSAKDMVSNAEKSAAKTVQYLPSFRRVFPQALLDAFKNAREQQQTSLRTQYCKARCSNKATQCLDSCNNFFKNELAEGHQFIRKVHKEYKIPVVEDEQ